MCLDELADFRITKKYGYAVFTKGDGGQLHQFFDHLRPDGSGPAIHVPVVEEDWQTDPNDYLLYTSERTDLNKFIREISIPPLPYKTGFHLFTNKKDAEYYRTVSSVKVIRKVRFKEVVAKGKQNILDIYNKYRMANVIVVRQRYVCKN